MNLDSMIIIGIMKEATCTYICVHIVQAPGQTLEQVPRGRRVENIATHFSPGRGIIVKMGELFCELIRIL